MRALLQLQHSTNSSSQLANMVASSTAATAGGSGWSDRRNQQLAQGQQALQCNADAVAVVAAATVTRIDDNYIIYRINYCR
eukprot:COSAG01_NODE_8042_length_2944_cov_33.888576_2_plen_81_part_00